MWRLRRRWNDQHGPVAEGLRALGADPVAAIPSRMEDGYGLNRGMVDTLHGQGIRVLVTVDNGVAADEALLRAQTLGVRSSSRITMRFRRSVAR